MPVKPLVASPYKRKKREVLGKIGVRQFKKARRLHNEAMRRYQASVQQATPALNYEPIAPTTERKDDEHQ